MNSAIAEDLRPAERFREGGEGIGRISTGNIHGGNAEDSGWAQPFRQQITLNDPAVQKRSLKPY
jgi:hypothetical protein